MFTSNVGHFNTGDSHENSGQDLLYSLCDELPIYNEILSQEAELESAVRPPIMSVALNQNPKRSKKGGQDSALRFVQVPISTF